jgi:hypothetical protein
MIPGKGYARKAVMQDPVTNAAYSCVMSTAIQEINLEISEPST